MLKQYSIIMTPDSAYLIDNDNDKGDLPNSNGFRSCPMLNSWILIVLLHTPASSSQAICPSIVAPDIPLVFKKGRVPRLLSNCPSPPSTTLFFTAILGDNLLLTYQFLYILQLRNPRLHFLKSINSFQINSPCLATFLLLVMARTMSACTKSTGMRRPACRLWSRWPSASCWKETLRYREF